MNENQGVSAFGMPVGRDSVISWLSFFMTTFYFFSGYLFHCKKDFRSFVDNKFRKLMIPFFTFSIMGLLIYELYYLSQNNCVDLGVLKSWKATGALRSNNPLWFFISLFCVNCIYYWVGKLQDAYKNILICFIFFIAWITTGWPQILGYGNILLGLVYFHMGVLLHRYQDKINTHKIFIIAIILYVSINLIHPQRLAFVLNLLPYGESKWLYPANLIFSLAACYILWFVCQRISLNNPFAQFIVSLGECSLVLFASHRFVLNWIYEPIARWIWPNIPYWGFLMLGLIVLIVSYKCIYVIFNKFCPQLIGQ